MKTVIIFLSLFLYQLNVWSAEAAILPCWKNPTYIKGVEGERAEALFQALPKKIQDEVINPKNGDFLSVNNVYLADINNDQKPENIFVSYGISSSAMPEIAIVDAVTQKYIGVPPNPKHETGGLCNAHTYTHGFLTKLCGKTYMSFSNNDNDIRDTYLWKNGITVDACDKDWMNYERTAFQVLYKMAAYDKAYHQLDFYLKKCKNTINPQDLLWMKNDAALAAFKKNDFKQCMSDLTEIEMSPAFAQSSATLKKSVTFNKTKCVQPDKQVALNTADSNPWILYLSSAKSDENYSVVNLKDLHSISTSIYPINNYQINTSVIDKTQKVKVVFLGQVSGINAYDVIYPLGKNNYLKTIFLEKKPNLYIPVYYNFIDDRYADIGSIESINKSFVVADKNLIVSEQKIAGNAESIDSFYLYVPADIAKNPNKTPFKLKTEIIAELIKQKISSKDYAVDGNAFDIKTLHFHSCISSEVHCFDPERTVDMQFKLEEGELKLVDFTFTDHKAKS